MLRLRALSPAGLLLVGVASSAACSAPPGQDGQDDSNTVPEFGGALPSAAPGAGSANTPNGSALGAGPATAQTGSPSSEAGNPASNVSLDPNNGQTGSSGAGAPPVDNAGGAGGATMTVPEPGSPGNGAGGSAMPSAAGGGNVPVDMGNQDPPPIDPGPQNPPPNDPPPVDPGPVGVGCAPGAALFCENFDAIPLGTVQGTINGLRPERTVGIIEEPGRGRVLQVQAGPGYENKNGVFLDGFSNPNNSHFGRAFIRVAEFPAAGGDHWVVVEATVNGGGGEQARPVGGQFGRWAPGSDGPSAGDWTDWEQSAAVTTAGAWECVEWQLNGANGAHDMLLWVDGVEVQPLDRANFRLPAVERLWLGWVVFQNSQQLTYDVRFDDIVLSTERVGCD